LGLTHINKGIWRTSQPQERDPAFEVHHQGHHKGLDDDLGQSPIAGLAQATELLALGELSLNLGAFPPGVAGSSGSGVTRVQAGSNPQGRQMGAIGFTVIGLVPSKLLRLGLSKLG
jgi:hypothetical protein